MSMNSDYPHDIIPTILSVDQLKKYVTLTASQLRVVEPMTLTARGKWLDEYRQEQIRKAVSTSIPKKEEM